MQQVAPKRIGVYGGTFDPIHNGHLRVAAAVCDAFALDKFLFVPAFIPPHKRGQQISAPYHRFAMAVLATFHEPRSVATTVSAIELEAPTRPYTIETLQRLQQANPEAALFFLMGADSFAEINLWRDYEQLLTQYNIIVAARPTTNSLSIEHLSALCQRRVVDLRGSKRPVFEVLTESKIFLTDYLEVDVAATQVREAVRAGHSITHMVPPDVARYIATYDLYRN